MKHKLFIPLILLGLLIIWQPLVAHDPDLQATLEKMQAQLEQQQKELAEQRILIQQLQGSQPAAKTGPHTPPAVAKSTDDPTVAAQQPGTDTPPAKADQSGQQQAVEALAQQQQAAPETSQ